jgi:hypothetical protein
MREKRLQFYLLNGDSPILKKVTEGGINRTKFVIFIFVVLFSFILAYLAQPFIPASSQAVNLIITVFSILAGFLVIFIVFAGDYSNLVEGSWRLAFFQHKVIRNRLFRHCILFMAYLGTLVLIFISIIIKELFPSITRCIEVCYLSIGFSAFFYSFFLPFSLMKYQDERIKAEINKRRKAAGISDDK